ncbi:MAG: MoxR family ATPase [Proteobacteria bacterium]|nr:MoxR family ATPase [Pseudomonadota bacterium]MBU1389229.1 MoxR family ATPase [Pseudomonadota bacterium]MBU1544793.1 MoxR family ATPase [Pseudomonadota bacterium]MBU2430636.1 MoxR family ATPase [Pseudomonadota bacterium]MBU2481897.1 MoxR family ATPase [Pseudomonadota bacterium]
MKADITTLKQVFETTKQEISKVIIGQQAVVDMALITIFTGHHALVEGVPGVAKTLLVRTLARILGCEFSRIQFTPDLMPADITGTNVFNMQNNSFSLVKGPVFTTFLLADEINRAPAKTQSALLQAMQEKNVTIDRDTYKLSENFTVFATQNPIEYEGTYPLPEAQKDRFLLKISMDTPSLAEELDLAQRMLGSHSPEQTLEKGEVRQVLDPNALIILRRTLEQILITKELLEYTVEVVRTTRTHEAVLTGAGPRGTQALILASRANAALNNRDFVTPDDIKYMAGPCLEHRIILRPEYEIEGLTPKEVIQQILNRIAVPR